MAIDADDITQYATFMADEAPRYLPPAISPSDGFPYALTQGFLAGTRWQGIVRFNPGEFPAESHTFAGCLVNAASLLSAPIAPGTIMTLFGEKIGPGAGQSFALEDGHVPFSLAGASITVDGKAAPILYAQDGQINFIAPWSLRTDGTRVPVCVSMDAENSCLYATTAPLSPGLFHVGSQIAAINQDGTVNSPKNPARSGSYIAIYFTGAGLMSGPLVDGGVAGSDLQPILAASAAYFTVDRCLITCSFKTTAGAPISFIGAAPSLVYGVDVVVVQVPELCCMADPTVGFILALRATPQSGAPMVSGTLYVKPLY